MALPTPPGHPHQWATQDVKTRTSNPALLHSQVLCKEQQLLFHHGILVHICMHTSNAKNAEIHSHVPKNPHQSQNNTAYALCDAYTQHPVSCPLHQAGVPFVLCSIIFMYNPLAHAVSICQGRDSL